MILSWMKHGCVLVAWLLLAGCASLPKEAGFASVQKTVMDRTGMHINWNKGTKADQAVTEAIRSMLGAQLTADEATQIALLNNQTLQATYEELGIAQADVVEAGLLRNPVLSAEVRFPKHVALPFEIEGVQSLLDLLLMPMRKRAAGAAFDAAKMRVTAEVLNMAADVKASFYRVQAAEQLVEMRRSIVHATDSSFDAARRLHNAGNISDLALANERALHEQAKTDLRRAEAEALDAREELNALMGVWGADTTWTVEPRLPALPPEEVGQKGLESLAVSQRADLIASRQEIEVAAQSLGLTRYAALGSDLSLSGHLERDADGTTTVGPGIQVPLPIFNQGQPAIAAAQARLRQSQRRYSALAVQVRAQVRRAHNKMIGARDRAAYLGVVIVPLRHEIVQQNQLQFNAMQIGVFELLQAKQAEIDAGREYIEALRDYWVARAELERAVGGPLKPSAPATQPVSTPSDAKARPADPEHHHHHGE
jgi:outer membrane protein, heavy metal efflux system